MTRLFHIIVLSRPPVWLAVGLSKIPYGQELRDLASQIVGERVYHSIVLAPRET